MAKNLNSKSDEELMELYQAGDPHAFEIIFQRHSGRVMGFLSKRLSYRRDAQDLFQEVFLKLHRSKHLYNSTLPFSPWLFSITRSVLMDRLKKTSLEDVTDVRTLESVPSAELSDISLSNRDSAELLNVLPLAQREAVSLRIYDEETFEEIASRLSTSPENARQLVSRGLKRLRELWGSKKD